jgi:hypothetical protein
MQERDVNHGGRPGLVQGDHADHGRGRLASGRTRKGADVSGRSAPRTAAPPTRSTRFAAPRTMNAIVTLHPRPAHPLTGSPEERFPLRSASVRDEVIDVGSVALPGHLALAFATNRTGLASLP